MAVITKILSHPVCLLKKKKKQEFVLYGRCGFVNKKTSRAFIPREVFLLRPLGEFDPERVDRHTPRREFLTVIRNSVFSSGVFFNQVLKKVFTNLAQFSPSSSWKMSSADTPPSAATLKSSLAKANNFSLSPLIKLWASCP